jgi:AcrR family transcriptional regulator
MSPVDRKRKPGRPRHPIGRDVLLVLARQAFAARGFAGVSMADVADSAGLRKASLFHNFASKDALYHEVIMAALADLGPPLARAREAEGDFLARLDHLADRATDTLAAHPDAARLLLRELMDGAAGHTATAQALDELAAFLQEGMLEGAIPTQDPHQLALSLASLHLGFFAVPALVEDLLEVGPEEPHAIAARKLAARAHTQRICGAG